MTISFTGAGVGTVTDADAGYSCTSGCSHRYPIGHTVSLAPTPALTSWLVSWGGPCSGTAYDACVFTVSGDVTVSADFEPLEALTITVHGPGTLLATPSNILFPPNPSESFPINTLVTLSSVTDGGNWVAQWRGACEGNAPSCQVLMDRPKSVEVWFEPAANYAFIGSVSVAPGALGSVAAADALCQAEAADAGLPGHFVALLPSASQSLSQRVGATARGWVRPDRRHFLQNLSDGLSDHNFFFYPLAMNERGGPSDLYAFTGVATDGTAGTNPGTCAFWTLADPSAHVQIGAVGVMAGSQWVSAGSTYFYGCDRPAQFYCLANDRAVDFAKGPLGTVRLAFVSETAFLSGGGLAAADQLCTNEATDAGLPGSYRALLATDSQSAASRFDAGGPPYARVDGVMPWPTAAGLLQATSATTLDAVITTNARGGYTAPGYAIWTGATGPSDVSVGLSCNGWTTASASQKGAYGSAFNQTPGYWFDYVLQLSCDATYARVYCLQR